MVGSVSITMPRSSSQTQRLTLMKRIGLALSVFVAAGVWLYIFPISFDRVQPYQGTELTGKASDFKLTDQNGSVVKLSDFRGRVVILTFMDTKCADTCPLTAFHFRQAYQQLESSEKEQVVFIGVNVNIDASEVADVYEITQAWRLDEISNWHFLTGSLDVLQPVWQEYGIGVISSHDTQTSAMTHTPGTYMIDPTGQKRWYISTPFSAEDNPEFALPLSELLVRHIREILNEN